MPPFAPDSLVANIAGIDRTEPGVPRNAEHIGRDTDWLYSIGCHVGGIDFRSMGFKQYMRGEAIAAKTQHLSLALRGGISFARSTYRAPAV